MARLRSAASQPRNPGGAAGQRALAPYDDFAVRRRRLNASVGCATSSSVVVVMLALETTTPSRPYLAIASRLSISGRVVAERRAATHSEPSSG
jgi:hypothetical protein